MGTKTCGHCKTTKPLSEFTANRCMADGLQSQCKTCRADMAQTYRTNKALRDMNSRLRTLINIAKDAGLDVLNHYQKTNRVWVDVRAPNGATSSFAMRAQAGRDVHADLNDAASVKRFARNNGAQHVEEASTSEPKKEEPVTAKQSAEASRAAEQLTMREFYQLCEWLKATPMDGIPNIAALALSATDKIGQVVSEATIREVMDATGTAEPEHWHPLPPADIVVVREMSLLLKALGTKPSSDFTRLAASMGVV